MENTCKKAFLEQMDTYARSDVAVAFSGGADSSLLLRAACEAAKKYGTKVYGIMVQTMLSPAKDLHIARQVAAESGAIFHVLTIDEFSQPEIRENAVNRCYVCKKFLFTKLKAFAGKQGISTILEGTNSDDLLVYRPGLLAIRELGIESPLAKAGMTKAMVRELARDYGISVADRPSSPCLATRFPYGTALHMEDIRRVEEGEALLHQLGFLNVRLRVHGNIARIEIDGELMERFLKMRREIVEGIKALGYDYITLDMEGFRSGSMDILQKNKK